jgi:hypothetical protein
MVEFWGCFKVRRIAIAIVFLGPAYPRVTFAEGKPKIISLQIIPAQTTISLQQTLQLSAIATLSDGTTRNDTKIVKWKSSSKQIVFVKKHPGLISASEVGAASITATEHKVVALEALRVVLSTSSLPIVLFSNPTDGEIMSIQTDNGYQVQIFGQRNAAGIPTDLTAFDTTDTTGALSHYTVDSNFRPLEIADSSGAHFQFTWASDTTGIVTATSPDGKVQASASLNLGTSVASGAPASLISRHRESSSESPPSGVATVRVSSCKGQNPEDGATVTFQIPFGEGSIQATSQGSGIYLAQIPSPSSISPSVQDLTEAAGELLDAPCIAQESASMINPNFDDDVCQAVNEALTAYPEGASLEQAELIEQACKTLFLGFEGACNVAEPFGESISGTINSAANTIDNAPYSLQITASLDGTNLGRYYSVKPTGPFGPFEIDDFPCREVSSVQVQPSDFGLAIGESSPLFATAFDMNGVAISSAQFIWSAQQTDGTDPPTLNLSATTGPAITVTSFENPQIQSTASVENTVLAQETKSGVLGGTAVTVYGQIVCGFDPGYVGSINPFFMGCAGPNPDGTPIQDVDFVYCYNYTPIPQQLDLSITGSNMFLTGDASEPVFAPCLPNGSQVTNFSLQMAPQSSCAVDFGFNPVASSTDQIVSGVLSGNFVSGADTIQLLQNTLEYELGDNHGTCP